MELELKAFDARCGRGRVAAVVTGPYERAQMGVGDEQLPECDEAALLLELVPSEPNFTHDPLQFSMLRRSCLFSLKLNSYVTKYK